VHTSGVHLDPSAGYAFPDPRPFGSTNFKRLPAPLGDSIIGDIIRNCLQHHPGPATPRHHQM